MEDLLSVDIGFVFNSHSGDGCLLMVRWQRIDFSGVSFLVMQTAWHVNLTFTGALARPLKRLPGVFN